MTLPVERPPAQPPTSEELGRRLRVLLTHAGQQMPCKKCGASVFWMQNRREESDSEPSAFDQAGFDHLQACPKSGAQVVAGLANREQIFRAIQGALSSVGDPGRCKGCGARIWWVRHVTGRTAPYDPEGSSHFASCTKAGAFRRGT